MFSHLKNWIIGSPLPTQKISESRLSNFQALAAFSPDALSSIAYANQEIFLSLLAAGAAGLSLSLPIGLAIAFLLIIVAASYSQTIIGYPSGGGSYLVARENLGRISGLVAASALIIDYLLNAAVSLTAGVAAIASAFPALWPYRVSLSLFLLLVITIINLRGLQESGTAMSIPVYFFLVCFLSMIASGVYMASQNPPISLAETAPPAATPLTLALVLHTFSAGCTALTGIEAISNGVPAFRPPEARNARKTLIFMAFLMAALFTGTIGLTQYFAVVANPQETILSALARRLFGSGVVYLAIQTSTLLILTVAANTSFAGFPRLAAILADDSYLPRQLKMLGDRLVYRNGIIMLAFGAAFLIIFFEGDTHALIPLFAIGAFLAFTLSQAGMVIHWLKEKGGGWLVKAVSNALGAAVTFSALMIIAISKFTGGAWITIILIPLLVAFLQSVHRHYDDVASQLTLRGLPPSLRPAPPPRVVIPVSGVHRALVDAINFARSISNDITAVYIEIEPERTAEVKAKWGAWFPDIPLAVVPSPYRSIVGPLLDFLDQNDAERHDNGQAVVILSEFVPARWWHNLLHNQTAFLIKTALLFKRRTHGFQSVIIDVPYHLNK
ncbi:MAG: APC family permease [Anaerolineae bacterium]|nr:APC family permease [Anaerolineae bacterium]